MACVSAVTASSYLPSVKARTPVSKYVWASWAASGIARKSSTPQSNHSRIDRRIASSLPARNSATDMASCPCKATDLTIVCQFPRIFLLYDIHVPVSTVRDESASHLCPARETASKWELSIDDVLYCFDRVHAVRKARQ